MKSLFAVAAVLALAGCASNRPTNAERLAVVQAHTGPAVKQFRYYSPMGWDKVDGEHVLLTMRPKEVWLLRLSGPCLDWSAGSPVLLISSQLGYVSRGFDKVSVADSQLSCRIEEIYPVDVGALRAAENALRASGAAGG